MRPNEVTQLLKQIFSRPELLGHMLGMQKLTSTHGEWIHKIWGNQANSPHMIMAHRGSYKTTAVVIVGVIWYLLRNPLNGVLIVHKQDDTAKSMLQAIAECYNNRDLCLLMNTAGFCTRSPLQSRSTMMQLFLTTRPSAKKDPSIMSSGIKSAGLTGRHFDQIHLDDVVGPEDFSELERNQISTRYSNLVSIVDPGGRVTATGTPYHPEDLYATVFKDKVEKYPLGTVNLSEESLEYMRNLETSTNLSPFQFASQYKLQFASDDELLFAKITVINGQPIGRVHAHLDAGYGGDPCALTIAYYGANEIFVRGFMFRKHVKDAAPHIIQKLNSAKNPLLLMERNDKGMAKKCFTDCGYRNISTYHESMNKVMKIQTYLKQYVDLIRFLDDSDENYIRQIKNWFAISSHSAGHDDAPDSLASLLMRKKFRPSKPQTSVKLSPEHYALPFTSEGKRHWTYDIGKRKRSVYIR